MGTNRDVPDNMTREVGKHFHPRAGLVAAAYGLVVLMTLYALALDIISVATNDYRLIVIQSVCAAAGSLLAAVVLRRHVRVVGRAGFALCCLVNLFTLVDAGGGRLPAVMGW
jgi:hypothetical protein